MREIACRTTASGKKFSFLFTDFTGVADRAEVIARTECGFALHSPLYCPLPQP